MSSFTFSSVPLQKGCRWFVKKGATTRYDRGFRSKGEADQWIATFREVMDWRAGYVFKLRDDSEIIEIRDRTGVLAKA